MAKENDFQRNLGKIKAALEDIFLGHIDMRSFENRPSQDKESRFLSRSYAALCIADKAGVTADYAAQFVTDGGDDDGIDAVYVDKKSYAIYCVQSKWSASGKERNVRLDEFNRFRDGIKNLIDQDWGVHNSSISKWKDDIKFVLDSYDARIYMIFAYAGQSNPSKNVESAISKFIDGLNAEDTDDIIKKEYFLIKDAVAAIRKMRRMDRVDAEIMIRNWGEYSSPYNALYGVVSASDFVEAYDKFGVRIYADNVRNAIDVSDVNSQIIRTAIDEPENFWYFNNGVTVICETFEKTLAGGRNRDSGQFRLVRFSIINGAQTIGSLVKAKSLGADISGINLSVKIISLKDMPDGHSVKITHANNMQNSLNFSDFVSADPNQDRLKREASVLGVNYSYKRGSIGEEVGASFDLRQATIALACSSGDIKIAVSSKRYISGLWENTSKEPYTKLFNDSLTAKKLWNIVRVLRIMEEEINRFVNEVNGRSRLICIHGNRFIQFSVFSLADRDLSGNIDFEDVNMYYREFTIKIIEYTVGIVIDRYADSYPGNIFKNVSKQSEIFDLLRDAFTLV